MITFGSLFTGIGGFDLGFERAGMKCLWQCEIDPACNKVLAKHWPDVRRYTDVREIGKHNLETVDVICGGFPCQDVSIAGKRAGLAGERSGLWSEFARIIDELNPGTVVIENVPGLLSSNRGRDFASVIRWLVERGYGVAWRILDAQYFGVAQRRRRVFIVASFGNGRAAEILFECEGVRWDTSPRGEAGPAIAETFTIRSGGEGGGQGYLRSVDRSMPICGQPQYCAEVSPTLEENYFQRRYSNQQSGEIRIQDNNVPTQGRHIGTGGNNVPMVGVRRLTPTECARLQGFSDDWNDWLADSARYRQYGNAVAVPVAEWIGRRIVEVTNGNKE